MLSYVECSGVGWAGLWSPGQVRKKAAESEYLGRPASLQAIFIAFWRNFFLLGSWCKFLKDASMTGSEEYQMLSLKYRPNSLDTLIGQDALVRVLRNSLLQNRVARSILLHGSRGVGKTTTARIIAKGLNCTSSSDEQPTASPCGVCKNCRMISCSMHMDVTEIDAASRTGVDDMREITSSIYYSTTMGRYRVYIIDEAHMLSRAAFNAFLKTLEEPPEHVVFILATTEIKKIPVTILSRCQCFDLRRICVDTMHSHLSMICEKEGIQATDGALVKMAQLADGSVRDALSLLDQMVVCGEEIITEQQVYDMSGLPAQGEALELFRMLVEGNTHEALLKFRELYRAGTDPINIFTEVAEICHAVSVCKISPDLVDKSYCMNMGQDTTSLNLSEKISVPLLTRLWQMLLKMIDEMSSSVCLEASAEMAIIRLTYMAGLPTPSELITKLTDVGEKEEINNGNAVKDIPGNIKEQISHCGNAEPLVGSEESLMSGESLDHMMKEVLNVFPGAKVMDASKSDKH